MNKLIERKKFNISKIILVLLFSLAIFLRAKVYFVNSSLWLDECSLAMNILHNKFFGTLEFGQAAPSGFLLLTKLITIIVGVSEASLRFLPFACSILSVFGFYYLSTEFLKKSHSVIFATFLFAVNYPLIYFSQEFKQYSSDVLIAILILFALSKINIEKLSAKNLLAMSAILSITLWVSFTSIFICSSAFILLFFKKFKEYKKLLALFLPFTLSALGYYSFNMSGNLDYLTNYSLWKEGFIDHDFSNFLYLLVENINYFFDPNKFALFGIILILSGIILGLKENKKNVFLLTFPIFALTLASYLHAYPFQQRVVLFLIPILILLMCKPLDFCSVNKKIISIIIIAITWLYFGGYLLPQYYEQIGSKNFFKLTDIRGLTKEFSKMSRQEDILVLAPSSSSSFEFYSTIYPVKYSQKFVGQMPEYDKTIFLNALNSLPKDKHYWFYIAHDVSHAPVRGFIQEWAKSSYKKVKEYTKGESYLIYAEVE